MIGQNGERSPSGSIPPGVAHINSIQSAASEKVDEIVAHCALGINPL